MRGILFYFESFSNTNNTKIHGCPSVIPGSNFPAMANHTIADNKMPDNGIYLISKRETIVVSTVRQIPRFCVFFVLTDMVFGP